MQSQMVTKLLEMGVSHRAESVAMKHSSLVGRLVLFLRNWEVVIRGPMGITDCPRVYIRLGKPTNPDKSPEGAVLQSHGVSLAIREGGDVNAQEEGHNRNSHSTGGQRLHLSTFQRPQKRWGNKAYNKSQGTEPLCAQSALQNGGHTHAKGCSEERRLDDKLKDASFMIPVAPNHRRLLRFRWQGKTYQLTCLPFGLSSAPWVFTKITKLIMTTLRYLGLRMIIYIDNILLIAETRSQAQAHTAGLIFLLESLGFIINQKKSIVDPTREIDFLGFAVHSQTMEIKVPGEKIRHLKLEAQRIVCLGDGLRAIDLSRWLGKLNHAALAIPPAPLFYRHLQTCLQIALETTGEQDYMSKAHLTLEAKEELSWWGQHLTKWNGRCLMQKDPDLIITTDASNIGWGAECQGERTGGPWSRTEATLHINCLELLAAMLAAKC